MSRVLSARSSLRRSSFHRRFLHAALIAATTGAAVSTAAGCPGSGGTGGSGGKSCLTAQKCYDYSCYKPGATRSFRTDVLPIFEQSCSLSTSCHGDPSSPTTGLGYQPYLGKTSSDTNPSDITKIFATVVGVASPVATNLKIIDPGNPENSFLMHKMDGDITCSMLSCAAPTATTAGSAMGLGCGVSMPMGVDPLGLATRDTVRDWIKQGAMNN